LQLAAIAIGENEVDLAVACLAREVVGVHSLVFGRFASLLQLLLDLGEQLLLHLQQRLA